MAEEYLLDVTDVVCGIGKVLEDWDGKKLAELHNDVCGSRIIYIGVNSDGDSRFADQEIWDQQRAIGKELDEHA